MNRIDELIASLSSGGVPHRPMGEIGHFFRGRRFTKHDRALTGIPSIHYGEIYTNYGTAASAAVSYVRAALADQLRYAQHGDVVFASVGETVEDVGKAVAWLGDSRVAIHDDCFAFRSEMNPVFVAYLSQTAGFKAQIERHVARAKVKRISARSLAAVQIPVPPLNAQNQVVSVLDELSRLSAELDATLFAERQARKAQFAHYRNALLAFERGGGSPRMALSELFELSTGRFIARALLAPTADAAHPYPCYGGNGLRGYAPVYSHEGPAILIGRQGALSGNVRRVDGKFYVTEHAFIARAADPLDTDWATHMLRRMNLNKYASRGALPGLAAGTLRALRMPVPSLRQQREAASMLGALETLSIELDGALSTERAVRRALFANRRDALLTFEELAA